MKESLTDLNSLLFEELERLGNDDLQGEELKTEMARASAMSLIARNIVNNGELALKALKFKDEQMDIDVKLPKLLSNDDE